MKLLSSFRRNIQQQRTSPNVTVAVAVWTIRDNTLQALLTEDATGSISLPSATLESGEKLADCIARILPDSDQSQHVFTEQVATVSAPINDQRGSLVTVSYVALTPYTDAMLSSKLGDGTSRIVPLDNMPALAYDHNTILLLTLRRLKYNLEYTNLVHTLLPSEFSFTQLQTVYETILGRDLDRRNFRKKFMLLELIEETGGMSSGGAHRPAKLYRFIDRGTIELRHWL